MPAEPRSIAICVDDFGLHEGVNQAVLRLADQARISAVSCMVGAPAWVQGAPALRAFEARRLDVGLHLDLTERPLDQRLRRPLAQWFALGTWGLVDRKAVGAEINAQLERFERVLGRAPAHVDGHQHVHQFPVIRELLVEVLMQRYAGSLPWLRSTRRPPEARRLDKSWLIERLGCNDLGTLAWTHGFAQNRSLLGVYDFRGTAHEYLARLAQWVEVAQSGDLLMCHPASAADVQDPILPARVREYGVLASDGLGDLLARQGVRIATLRDAACIPPSTATACPHGG